MSNRRVFFPAQRSFPIGVMLFLVAAVCAPATVMGQTLRGSVLEEGRDTPVARATISLLDGSGVHRAQTMSDSLGHFVLTPPEAGEYVIEAVGLGYEPTRTSLLAMTVEGSVPFDVVLRPKPIGLEGFEVEVDAVDVVATRLLQLFGQTPETLGRSWIGREELDKRPASMLSGVVRWQSIPGASVPVGNSPGQEALCVIFRQRGPCALTVLNGIIIDQLTVNQLPPGSIEAMAILRPMEATTYYGTQGGGGAVLLWTRAGGR